MFYFRSVVAFLETGTFKLAFILNLFCCCCLKRNCNYDFSVGFKLFIHRKQPSTFKFEKAIESRHLNKVNGNVSVPLKATENSLKYVNVGV